MQSYIVVIRLSNKLGEVILKRSKALELELEIAQSQMFALGCNIYQ